MKIPGKIIFCGNTKQKRRSCFSANGPRTDQQRVGAMGLLRQPEQHVYKLKEK